MSDTHFSIDIYSSSGKMRERTIRTQIKPKVTYTGGLLTLEVYGDRIEYLKRDDSLVVYLPTATYPQGTPVQNFVQIPEFSLNMRGNSLQFVSYSFIEGVENPYRGFHLKNVTWRGIRTIDYQQDVLLYLHTSFGAIVTPAAA